LPTEKEVRATIGDPVDPALRRGKKVFKMVRSKADGSVYLVPLPSLVPTGLHVSQHPSGEFHIRTPDRRLNVSLSLPAVIQAALAGRLDGFLESILQPPPPGHRAKVTLLPTSTLTKPDPTVRREEIALDDFIAGQVVVELEDTDDVGSLIDLLAKDGRLRPGDALQLEIDGGTDVSLFRYVGRQSGTVPMAPLSTPTPFDGALRQIDRSIREFGGIFLTFASDDLDRLQREVPAFGDLMGQLKILPQLLGSEEEQERMIRGFLEEYSPAATELEGKPKLKFRSGNLEDPDSPTH
jgi:hypothetical protein